MSKLSLASVIARVLQASSLDKLVIFDFPDAIGEVKIHQQRIAPSGSVEQLLLTYDGDEYSIVVEKWADALPPKE